MKVVIDLRNYFFVHAILIVDDTQNGFSGTYTSLEDQKSFLQNIEIYIGDDPLDHTNNSKCPGGPFLDVEDEDNWYYPYDRGIITDTIAWKYGKETWCNTEGKFVHIIANL